MNKYEFLRQKAREYVLTHFSRDIDSVTAVRPDWREDAINSRIRKILTTSKKPLAKMPGADELVLAWIVEYNKSHNHRDLVPMP
jgi:hypothetical protein